LILRISLLVLAIVLASAGLMSDAHAAQSPTRLIKIGALTESWGPSAAIVGLRDGLQALGLRENEHFVIGVRFTQGNLAELPEAARSLVQRGSDIVVTGGGDDAAMAAKLATTQIPVVFMGASDPVASGLVKSFARPGGNITGVADLGVETAAKRLEILHELVPGLKRVLFVYNANDSYALAGLGAHRDAARRLGLLLVEKPVRSQEEAQAVIGAARKTEVDGMFSPSRLSLNIPGSLLEMGTKRAPHDVS
jgi:putative ABC transport system substrate-binding protein